MIRAYLEELTRSAGGRPVGSSANHAAEAYIAAILRDAGYEVEQQQFDCIDWRLESVDLWLGDGPLPVRANPFSPPCDVTSSIVPISNTEELKQADIAGKIVVLHDSLTESPLFPRNYPFFSVEEHKYIIELLEAGQPQAIIAISPQGGNPAPVIEDGDFTVPSVTVSADVGAVLMDAVDPITVKVRSTSRPGHAANVIGRRVHPARDKIVLTAHFDTKPDTPGALDNAAGVATILTLAQRLSADNFERNLEVVAFNGEDHYAAPGEVAYINGCGSEFGRIALVINVDGVGLRDENATVSFFNCDYEWVSRVRNTITGWSRFEESPPWPEGDHTIFAMQGVPCIALTSGTVHDLIDKIIHTPQDTLELVEPEQIANVVEFLVTLLREHGLPMRPQRPDIN
jgi:aminopeptidase YwaD